jgi:hypothetical protein
LFIVAPVLYERGIYLDTVVPQEGLKEIFDQITRGVTQQAAGISLHQGNVKPTGEMYTVYATFERGLRTSVSMCAEASLFARLTKYMMQEDEITHQDVEDFSKEYFNMLCGQIAARLYQVTKVASRFGIPSFHQGRYVPEGCDEHFELVYTSDGNENAELTCLEPEEK